MQIRTSIALSLIDLRSQSSKSDDDLHSLTSSPSDDEQLETLMASIKKDGLMNPPTVRKNKETGRYNVIFGNRRIMALQRLGITVVDCIVI